VARQELEHAMPPAEDIAADVVAAADEIAHRLLGLGGDVHGGEFAGPEQSHQLRGVPRVSLDPLPRAARGQCRRNDVAGHTEPDDLAIEIVAGHPGFVARGHRPFAGSVPTRNNPRLCNRSGRSFPIV
jgi:hypothetical protein